MACLARACASWHDDVWLVDSTPVECGRSRETQKRSERPGWATYGYSASHSRYFWGLRLHLITTPSGLPITFALAGAKADERDVCLDMIARAGVARRAQTLIAEVGYRSAAFEAQLNNAGITLIGPATKTEPTRARAAVPAAVPPDHRIGQPDPQSPTRPRTPRRAHPRRRRRARPATTPRPHRHDLAQPNHPTTRPRPLPTRLRPLTPWN